MTPRGHLLHVCLHLPHAPHHALASLPYLGGVLHGCLRERWLSLPPEQYAALDPGPHHPHHNAQTTAHLVGVTSPSFRATSQPARSTPQPGQAQPTSIRAEPNSVRAELVEAPAPTPLTRWRIIPPAWPTTTPPRWLNEQHRLHLALVIHAGAELPIERATAALQGLQWLGAGRERYRVAQVQVQAQPLPAPWPEPTCPAQPEPPPPGQAPSHHLRLRLRWLTPVHLASRAQVRAGHGHAAPSLLRLLRSLATRAQQLEPAWAAAWGLAIPAWVRWQEHWRHQPEGPHHTQPVSWPYGSRTKSQVLHWQGLLGQQQWHTHLPPAALALLAIGPWLGVGEGASFGCGHFEWQVEPLSAPIRAKP